MQDKTTETKPAIRKRFERVVCEEDGIDLLVYPLNYGVMEQHADAVAHLLQAAGKIEALESLQQVAENGDGSKLWMILAPLCGRTILRLINDCCVPTLADSFAPPDVVAEVAGKWLQLSFLRRGSYTRVMNAAGSLVEAATGERVDLQSQLQSLFDSVTGKKKSTPAADTTGTLNADGQSPNSPKPAEPAAV
jgi:hypothetical protein